MSFPIILGHHDVLFRLSKKDDPATFLSDEQAGQIDLPRLYEADILASFFACWAPGSGDPTLEEDSEDDPADLELSLDEYTAPAAADDMIDLLRELERDSEGALRIVESTVELACAREDGVHGAILHFEGAEPIEENLSNLEDYYSQGLRSLGLVWARRNVFGVGVPFRFPSSPDIGPGLTRAGFELVRECNNLGVMIDVSHLNEAGFWDVVRCSDRPIVATHSNAHALCPSARNLTDQQLQAIADSGGVVGVNFCTADLRDDGEDDEDTDSDLVVQQIEYLLEKMGPAHVVLGTDFDGAIVPAVLDGVDTVPGLMAELALRGLSDSELEQIGFQNWYRVLADTWYR